MEIRTNIAELTGPAPLYNRSPYEPEPFPAYMQIDPGQRQVTFGTDGDPRALAENIYCGRVYRADVPNNLTSDRIKSLLLANLPRIQAIIGGYSETVDQHGDRIGHLTEAAQAALAELRAELESIDATDGPDVYASPTEYFDIFDYAQADSPDTVLQQIAIKIATDHNVAFANGAEAGDIFAALVAKRAELRDAED